MWVAGPQAHLPLRHEVLLEERLLEYMPRALRDDRDLRGVARDGAEHREKAMCPGGGAHGSAGQQQVDGAVELSISDRHKLRCRRAARRRANCRTDLSIFCICRPVRRYEYSAVRRVRSRAFMFAKGQCKGKQALGFALLSAMRLRCLIRDSHHGPARARATENGAGPSVRRCRSSVSASATARGPWSTSRKGEGDEGPPRRPFSPACHGGEPPRHLSLTSMHVPRVIAVARSRI